MEGMEAMIEDPEMFMRARGLINSKVVAEVEVEGAIDSTSIEVVHACLVRDRERCAGPRAPG